MGKCILCGGEAVITRQDNSSRSIYNCRLCGVFLLSDLSVKQAEQHAGEIMAFLRGRKLRADEQTVLISFDKANLDKGYLQVTVDQIASLFPKSFDEFIELTLDNLVRMSKYPGYEIKVESVEMAPLFYVRERNLDSLSFVIKELGKLGLIDINYYGATFFPCGVVVSAEGWDKAAGIRSPRGGSDGTGLLVLGRRNDESESELRAAAEKAMRECDLNPVESLALGAEGRIGNALAAQLRRSALIICDAGGTSPEPYFAAGYAKALRKPVLAVCPVSDRAKLRIDPSLMGVLFWENHTQLYLELLNYIRAQL